MSKDNKTSKEAKPAKELKLAKESNPAKEAKPVKEDKVKLNHIGLDTDKTKQLAKQLNELLANYQVFYMNARGYHYNIRWEKFFELHIKFEELYSNIILKADEIAERVLTLGETPTHAYSGYLKISEIKEKQNVTNPKEAISEILSSFAVLLTRQREILSLSDEANDEGTNAQMSDYIREQEKLVWMYSAYLGKS
ncbi:Dps family protein [soil metagenome]